jgi:hypothetical protein
VVIDLFTFTRGGAAASRNQLEVRNFIRGFAAAKVTEPAILDRYQSSISLQQAFLRNFVNQMPYKVERVHLS